MFYFSINSGCCLLSHTFLRMADAAHLFFETWRNDFNLSYIKSDVSDGQLIPIVHKTNQFSWNYIYWETGFKT